MLSSRSHSLQPPTAPPLSFNRRVISKSDPTNESSTIMVPIPVPTHLEEPSHLPFFFGAEFELILRPKDTISQMIQVPDFDASVRETRDFNLALLRVIASLLTTSGMPCNVYDHNSDETIDYTQWNATLDGSISKKHIKDKFYPVEIVTPILRADSTWTQTIDRFWSILEAHFELRRDMSCGFHVHISAATKTYSLAQLRHMAKATVFWEPATARCAPPSRQDHVLGMCKSNVQPPVPVAFDLQRLGPWRGLSYAFEYIDNASRDEIVQYVCTDKFRAWNFNPCKEGGMGSIEFRRAPGVVGSKKSKHWIAFVMAFVEMAIRFNPTSFADSVETATALHSLNFPDFKAQLLACAETLGVYAELDPRLQQPDNPRTLHITTITPEGLRWLQQWDTNYKLSMNY